MIFLIQGIRPHLLLTFVWLRLKSRGGSARDVDVMSAARFSSAASFSDSDSLIAQAERCRSLGQTFRDFSLRRRMFELAMDYEELAEEALRHEGMSIQIGS